MLVGKSQKRFFMVTLRDAQNINSAVFYNIAQKAVDPLPPLPLLNIFLKKMQNWFCRASLAVGAFSCWRLSGRSSNRPPEADGCGLSTFQPWPPQSSRWTFMYFTPQQNVYFNIYPFLRANIFLTHESVSILGTRWRNGPDDTVDLQPDLK